MNSNLQKELHERFGEEIFDHLCTEATDGLWYLDLENYSDEWISPNFRDRLGASAHCPVQDLIHPDDRELALVHLQNHCADASYRYDFILRFHTTDSGTLRVRRCGRAIRNSDGKPVRMIGSHTVVEQIQGAGNCGQPEDTEQQITRLQASNERYRLFAKSMGAAMWSRSTSGGVDRITWSDEFWELLGYDGPQEYTFGLFREHLDEHDRKRYTDAITLMHQQHQPLDIEVQAYLKNGGRRWFRVTAEIVHNANGTLDKVVGSLQDIEKLHRLQALNQNLSTALAELQHQSVKLRASNDELCSFAYASSHDIKAPMNSIKLVFQVLGEEIEEGNLEFARNLVNDGMKITGHGLELVDDILDYVQVVSAEQTTASTDLSAIVSDIIAEIVTRPANTAELADLPVDLQVNVQVELPVDVQVAGALPAIEGDPRQLRILMYHLIHNATKFRKEGIQHEVRIEAVSDDTRFGVAITDNGIGIDEKKRQDIFKMFMRLNSVTEFAGNGLGLALCKRIALNHKAVIDVKSTIGEGSTFTVWFPPGQHN